LPSVRQQRRTRGCCVSGTVARIMEEPLCGRGPALYRAASCAQPALPKHDGCNNRPELPRSGRRGNLTNDHHVSSTCSAHPEHLDIARPGSSQMPVVSRGDRIACQTLTTAWQTRLSVMLERVDVGMVNVQVRIVAESRFGSFSDRSRESVGHFGAMSDSVGENVCTRLRMVG